MQLPIGYIASVLAISTVALLTILLIPQDASQQLAQVSEEGIGDEYKPARITGWTQMRSKPKARAAKSLLPSRETIESTEGPKSDSPAVFARCPASVASPSEPYSQEPNEAYFLSKLAATPVQTSPFSWVYWCDLLRPELYQQLVRYFPPNTVMPEGGPERMLASRKESAPGKKQKNKKNRKPPPRYHRYTMGVEDMRNLTANDEELWPEVALALPAWEALEQMMFSEKVEDMIWKKFDMKVKPVSRNLRIQTDLEGYALGVHNDGHGKIFTLMIYFPEEDNRATLEYGTCLHTESQYQHRDRKKKNQAECFRKFPYSDNSGYAFAVNNISYHSVPCEVGPTWGMRRTILANWYDETRGLDKI
mmetsp:Transcript_30474/g.58663  ORF Transcript_30474/g.58663 Transcript_30474/m.58663 type:complete len:363 (+) Transcript_30474:69-1157(+)